MVNEAIYLWHDAATLGLDETLFVNNEIQKIKKDKQVLNVLSTRYFIYYATLFYTRMKMYLLIFGSLIWNMTKLKKNLLLLIVNS